jgi:site-specific DNA recombinase
MRTPTNDHKNTNRAIGYVRVSTQEQAQDGVSLDVQRDKIRAYCKSHGIRLIDIKADHGISGGTMERPALQAAIAAIDRGQADTLIVVKLDRLTRSVKDLCHLVDKYFAHEASAQTRAALRYRTVLGACARTACAGIQPATDRG